VTSPNNQTDRPLTIGVVDDDPEQRRLLRQALEEAGYNIVEGADGTEAVALARERLLDALLLDVRMPRMSGLEALRVLKDERPEIIVLLLTAFIDVRDAVAAIKAGAQDYLEKPIDLDELVIAVDEALGVEREGLPFASAGSEEFSLPERVVAESQNMTAVLREAMRVAPTDVSILICGDSGTGKEVVARLIHERSRRNAGPLVTVNCAALPENLIESELFGHERGAFTGAVGLKKGRFEEAAGSTLFLDEIGEMPLALQPKLLRVLEDRAVRRIGGTRDIVVDVRVLAATNRNLEDEVREGRFREDLYYRLNVVTLRLPPLRERRGDILPLADRFLEEQGMGEKRFSPAAQRLLVSYAWPGNARELRNAAARAAIMARGSVIVPDDLPEPIRFTSSGGEHGAGETSDTNEPRVLVGDMEEIQRRAILEALEKTGGNKTQAAKLLGISRRNLIYKLRSYGM